MKIGIYVAIIVISLIVRLIIWAAKQQKSSPPPRYNPPPQPGAPMKQPPPYIPPSQQPEMTMSDFLNTQKPSFEQSRNIFNTPPPFTAPVKDAFDEQQSSFSNMTTRNTNSNMGAGAQSYYCMYCGKKFQSVSSLKMDTCFKHPKADQGLQKHVLYNGPGKPNIGF
jgi:hypothetical protein